MMTDKVRLKELFEEKSLGSLLAVYEGAFLKKIRAKIIGLVAGVLALVFATIVRGATGLDSGVLDSGLSLLTSYALVISTALMGIVIAGMSIFAAGLRSDVASALIETNYPKTKISALKFIFAMFAYVLFALFLLMSSCLVYFLFLGKDALGAALIVPMLEEKSLVVFYEYALVIYGSLMIGLTAFLLSLLHSFIWNLHQVLMTVVAASQLADKPSE